MRNHELYPPALSPGKIIRFSSHPRESRTWCKLILHIRKLGTWLVRAGASEGQAGAQRETWYMALTLESCSKQSPVVSSDQSSGPGRERPGFQSCYMTLGKSLDQSGTLSAR